MEKPLAGKCHKEVWFGILVSFVLCFTILCFDYSTSMLGVYNGVNLLVRRVHPYITRDSCYGRYIYVHDDLPAKFNDDLLKNCQNLTTGSKPKNSDTQNMCRYIVNLGLGPEIEEPEGVLANESWFITNPYLLEVIFHNKMKQYKCLTNNSNQASAIYVPSYVGLDASLHLWDFNLTVRDYSAKDLVGWLSGKPEWKKMWGRDHFMVAGRTSWDLGGKRRIVLIGNRVRSQKRPFLFTFVGAPRPDMKDSIRGKLIDQCQASSNCNLQGIHTLEDQLSTRFWQAAFRFSFHPATAYTQYLWHLPENHTKYSVFVPVKEVENLKEGIIEKTLLGISKHEELAMREEVIRLIPNLVYADPRSRLETEDAFDIAVQGILERIENVREVIRERKDPSIGFADEDNFKFTFPETPE
ncbi:unnamed protein product [Prunus armeniaca]|uniref:Exostosin GT47 domain-containing protein n=1 Tax=Prunus armeniaca TaxID=36596 RepID=A0A6J5TGR2_PRUAR|nr:unnamed protein product [Prunus armeniaca]